MTKTASLALSVLLVTSAILVIASPTAVSAGPACQVPSDFATIQAALASTCSTINVAAGTYDEQLTISRPVVIQGAGSNGPHPTIIQPSSVVANACRFGGSPLGPTDSFCDSPVNSNPTEAAIILVTGTTGVTIKGLEVDGSVAATGSSPLFTSCASPRYDGILFSSASGTVSFTQVTNLYQSSPSLYGCQDDAGLGIYVQSPTGASTVSINHDVVTNYQKNGITCNDASSQCSIDHDTTMPLAGATGPTGDGTNGIQVGFGAVGTVTNNNVSGNECNIPAPICGSDFTNPTEAQAAGILLFLAGDGTSVANNQVSTSDIGLAAVGPNSPGAVTLKSNQLKGDRYAGVIIESGAFTIQDTMITGPGIVAVGVIAFSSNGDVSSSATLQNVNSDLAYFTYATPPLTAYIFIK